MVFSHPVTLSEYFTNTGDTKYPNDPAQVTIPVAMVLFDDGKCLATTETGIPIAVDPRPTPIRTPIV